MNFPVYEGVHEAIIAEEDWELAQEKRSKNNYRREKIHDPEHAHILSGILKCPCCGKGMYGNIAKAGRKDNKTRYLGKQLSVLNASLHQAETIKTRIEQQMDNLDVTDTHYDKKISDLQRRLDAQYDRIDEAYSECTDAEKKQFMQAFIERIDIFPERREDGNWIRNIRFQFPVPILRDGKEVVRVDGISLDKEKSDEHTVTLEKFPTLETVVLLSYKKPDGHINVKVEFGEGEGKVPLDNIAKRAEEYKPKERVTYKMIKEYIEAKYGFKVHTAYIAEVKRDLGLPMYDAPNAVEELKQPRKHPTAEKVEAIKDALKHFEVI